MRVAYEIEDLKLIFERSPMYAGCEAAHRRRKPGKLIVKDSVFWAPLFALFSGARLGEIVSSTVDDYRVFDEINYLEIHAHGHDRFVKTRAAPRRIPIHSELIKIGFLSYLEQQRAKGNNKVFEEVEGRRNISSPAGWTQTWQIYQSGLGIDDRRKVFYSFRHAFKRACREAGIEEEVHDVITGHRGFQSGRRCGSGVSLQLMAKAMEKVEYPGLDLSHLYE